MLNTSIKLLMFFLISFKVVDLRELRQDNKISVKELQTASEENPILSEDLRKISELTYIKVNPKLLLKSIQNFQKIFGSRPQIINKIYINITGNKKDDDKNFIDNLFKLPNKDIQDVTTNAMKISTCPFGQVYVKSKECIFTTETYDETRTNSLKKDFNKSKLQIKGKIVESENEQFIHDLIIGDENSNDKFRIYLNNPKYEVIQEKLKHKNHLRRNNIDEDETFTDISLKTPFVRIAEPHLTFTKVENPKKKFTKLPLFHSVYETRNVDKNLDLVRDVSGKNLIFELDQPYKLIKKEKHAHVINNEFVSGFKNLHSNKKFRNTNSVKKDYEKFKHDRIKFKIPESINYGRINRFHTIYIVPKTNLTAEPGLRTEMINEHSKASKRVRNNIQLLNDGLNKKNQVNVNPELTKESIPSKRKSSPENSEIMLLRKKNEELKKTLANIYHETNVPLQVKNPIEKPSSPETNPLVKKEPNFLITEKPDPPIRVEPYPTVRVESNQPKKVQAEAYPNLLVRKEPNPPVREKPSTPILVPQSKTYETKEKDNISSNAKKLKFSGLMDKLVELDKQGKAPELNKFAKSRPDSAITLKSSPSNSMALTSPIDNDSEEAVDEGEISENSSVIKTIDSSVNSLTASDSEHNAKSDSLNLTKTDSLPEKNAIANISKEAISPIAENMKVTEVIPSKEMTNRNKISTNLGEIALTTSSPSNLTSEQPNLNDNIVNSPTPIELSDFDHSTVEFPKQAIESVDALLKANPPSYDFKSLG